MDTCPQALFPVAHSVCMCAHGYTALGITGSWCIGAQYKNIIYIYIYSIPPHPGLPARTSCHCWARASQALMKASVWKGPRLPPETKTCVKYMIQRTRVCAHQYMWTYCMSPQSIFVPLPYPCTCVDTCVNSTSVEHV